MLPDGPWQDISLHPAQRADLLRVKVVQMFGGWYADVDCYPGSTELYAPKQVELAIEDSRRFINCFFGAPLGSEFLDVWMSQMLAGLQESKTTNIAEVTGPGALARAIYVYAARVGAEDSTRDLRTMSWQKFSHIPGSLVTRTGVMYERTFKGLAIHIGSGTWASQGAAKKFKGVKRIIWQLRHSSIGRELDLIRSILVRQVSLRSVFNRLSRYTLLNADINADSVDVSQLLRPVPCPDAATFGMYLPVLSHARIESDSAEVIRTASYAGWKIVRGAKHPVALRPNVRHLVG